MVKRNHNLGYSGAFLKCTSCVKVYIDHKVYINHQIGRIY